jgi:hypothetical protein
VFNEYALSISWQRKKRRVGGGPPFLKLGRMVKYRRVDIEDYLGSHLVKTNCSKESK